jgi:hypothetical protein
LHEYGLQIFSSEKEFEEKAPIQNIVRLFHEIHICLTLNIKVDINMPSRNNRSRERFRI